MLNWEINPATLHKSHKDDVLLARPRQALACDIASLNSADDLSALGSKIVARARALHPSSSMNFQPPLDQAEPDLAALGGFRQRSISYQALSLDGHTFAGASEAEIDHAVDELNRRAEVDSVSTSFSFVNSADHYFFYRKPHEHVPGIMLLEAARQTIYYQLYTRSERTLGEVTVSLSSLNARFIHYAELMYPIEIIVDDLAVQPSRRPSLAHYLTSFYQRGVLIAEVEARAPVISLKRFELARNAHLLGDASFAPLPGVPLCTLISAGGTEAHVVELKHVSECGCSTTAPPTQADDMTITLIYASKLTFTTRIVREGSRGEDTLWRFAERDADQAESLKEIVKRGFIAESAI